MHVERERERECARAEPARHTALARTKQRRELWRAQRVALALTTQGRGLLHAIAALQIQTRSLCRALPRLPAPVTTAQRASTAARARCASPESTKQCQDQKRAVSAKQALMQPGLEHYSVIHAYLESI